MDVIGLEDKSLRLRFARVSPQRSCFLKRSLLTARNSLKDDLFSEIELMVNLWGQSEQITVLARFNNGPFRCHHRLRATVVLPLATYAPSEPSVIRIEKKL